MKKSAVYIAVLLVLLTMFGLVFAQSQKGTAKWKNTEAIELKGKITNILKPFATMESENKTYKVHLGPVWYWSQEKLDLKNGDTEIVGKMEESNGELHVYPGTIKQGNMEIVLTDDAGNPKWMGQGKMNKKSGMGKGQCQDKQKGQGKCQRSGCGSCGGCQKNKNN